MAWNDNDALEEIRRIVNEYAEKGNPSIPTHLLVDALGGY